MPPWCMACAQANAAYPSPTLTSAVNASLSTPGSLSLAIDRTFVSAIAGRYTPGIFGLGWTTSWQSSLSTDSSGNVTIDTGDRVYLSPTPTITASSLLLGSEQENGVAADGTSPAA